MAGLLKRFTPGVVIGQHLVEFLQVFGIELLDGASDPLVDLPTPVFEDALIGDLLGEERA